jgi:signal transduction histidine kinase
MRWTFGAKLMAIVGVAAFALLLIISTSSLIAARVEERLSTIQGLYLPKVELEPKLDAELEHLRRAFQDAVAVHESEALAGTRPLEQEFLATLDASRSLLDPKDSDALRSAMEDYYAAAFDVSRRLIANETGEPLLDAVAGMQTKQARLTELLKTSTRFDREELGQAFAATTAAERVAGTYRLWISVGCLALVLLLSLALSRSLFRSLAALTAGIERFGRGEFGSPIAVATHDELGDVADAANRMAKGLEVAQAHVVQRTAELEVANKELEAFSYSVAHDLRAPLRGVSGFAEVLLEEHGAKLDDDGRECLDEILASARRMEGLIDALLSLSRVTRAELKPTSVDLSALARSIVKNLETIEPKQGYDLVVADGVKAEMDPGLARAILENLLGNAWKFTSKCPRARIEFGAEANGPHGRAFFVRDNGAGFDSAYADKLFAPFQRLHTVSEFQGTGIGLATVQRIVHRHGGRVWAEGKVNGGATFHFTIS